MGKFITYFPKILTEVLMKYFKQFNMRKINIQIEREVASELIMTTTPCIWIL